MQTESSQIRIDIFEEYPVFVISDYVTFHKQSVKYNMFIVSAFLSHWGNDNAVMKMLLWFNNFQHISSKGWLGGHHK